MLLSARARRPVGNRSATLPSGRPKTRSISRVPVSTDASRRNTNFRVAGNSLMVFFLIFPEGLINLSRSIIASQVGFISR